MKNIAMEHSRELRNGIEGERKEVKSPEERTKQVRCVRNQKADTGSAEPQVTKK